MENWSKIRINEARFRQDFEALSQIGATWDGGVHRPALSEAHLAARAWFRENAERAGLQVVVDGAGNHSAVLSSPGPGAKTVLLGSHLDSVPHGGRFDGALGALAALEVLRTVSEAGLELPVNLEAVDFTDQEGTLVNHLGSFAFTGRLTPEDLANPPGGRSALKDGLRRAGLDEKGILAAGRNLEEVAAYLELHVEQGSQLERCGFPLGVVSSITGISLYRLTFTGRADHAGSRAMADRLDAGQGASLFALSARELVLEEFPSCMVNVGDMRFSPGTFNTVPERVEVSLEFRAPNDQQLALLEKSLLSEARRAAEVFGLRLEVDSLGTRRPAEMDSAVQAAIESAAGSLGLKYTSLVSGPGHDARSFAGRVPTGMIFLPSVGGAFHTPREHIEWEHCVNGANTLLQTALRVSLN